jgi:hypothetical protein
MESPFYLLSFKIVSYLKRYCQEGIKRPRAEGGGRRRARQKEDTRKIAYFTIYVKYPEDDI